MKSLAGAKANLPTEPPAALTRREVAVGYAWNALFGVVGKTVLQFLFSIFVYRLLGPDEIGVFAMLIPIYMISESLRDAGLALTYVADREADYRREGEYATLAVLNAFVFAAIIFGLRNTIAAGLGVTELVWGLEMVALAILMTGFSTIPANKLQKSARFRDAGIADFASTVLSIIVAFALILVGYGWEAIVWQFVAKSAFYGIACWYLAPVGFHWVHKGVLKAIGKRAGHNLLNNVLFTVYTVADNLLIGKLFGKVGVGNYNAAYTFGTKPLEFFTLPLAKTLLVAYSRKSDDKQALANIFTRTITVSVLIMVPLYTLIGVFAEPLLMALVGTKYKEAVPLLSVLALYCGFRSFGSLSGNVLVAMNKPVYNVYGWLVAYTVVGAVLWANWGALSLILVVKALTAGAAAVYLVNAIAAFSILKPDRSNLTKLTRAFCLAVAASAVIYAASQLPFGKVANLILVLSIATPAYLGAVSQAYTGVPNCFLSKEGLRELWAKV